MYEKQKLDEAIYFLSRMSEEIPHPVNFKYNLSAFLTACRSVLQYALEEAKTKPGGQNWYDIQVRDNDVLAFFKDMRDVNIHEKPIEPAIGIIIRPAPVTATLSVGSVGIIVQDQDGQVLSSERSSPKPLLPFRDPLERTMTIHRYYFTDWKATSDKEILSLSENYLQELTVLMNDGISKGFLTL